MRRLALLLATGALSLPAAACSASSGSNAAADAAVPGDDGGPASGDGGDASVDASGPAPCSQPPDKRPDGGTCVLEATGKVEDFAGAPLPDLVMTFCGPPQCYGTKADGAGVYSIPIGDFVVTADFAVHADGRPDHAVDYFRLSAGEPQVISVDMRLPALPPSTVALPPDGDPASNVTVGDVTLQIAAGTKFDLDIEDFGTATGRIFRVAAVPLASAPAYAASNNVDAIYALAPSSAKPSQKMGVSVRNSAALPASAAVDILVLSDDYFSTPPAVGTLVLQAAAHVSADGTTIQTDPGEGITEITWLAVRRKGK
jgi:hypothetical protein